MRLIPTAVALAAFSTLANHALGQLPCYLGGTRHAYQQTHSTQLSWSFQNPRNLDPRVRLAYISGSWTNKVTGDADRGGTDMADQCQACCCDYVSARTDPPPYGDSSTTSVSFHRADPGHSFLPPFVSGSSASNASSTMHIAAGRLNADFDLVGDPTCVACYSNASTFGSLSNISGTSVAPSPFCSPCLFDCSNTYSYYVDHAHGNLSVSEKFVLSVDAGRDPTSLFFSLSGVESTSTSKNDYWVYQDSCGVSQPCPISLSCVGTPAALGMKTNFAIKISIYKRLSQPAGNQPPVLGPFAGSQSFSGTMTSSGTTLTAGGVFAPLDCSPDCIIYTPNILPTCAEPSNPVLVGESWSGNAGRVNSFTVNLAYSTAYVAVIERTLTTSE